MVSVMLMLKHSDDQSSWEGGGRQEFSVMPRVGDHIDVSHDGTAYLYRVVAVCHPTHEAANAGDVFAVNEGTHTDVVKILLRAK